MKRIALPLLIFIGINALIFYLFIDTKAISEFTKKVNSGDIVLADITQSLSQLKIEPAVLTVATDTDGADDTEVIADNLHIPWDFVFLPNGDILITERRGTIVRITGEKKQRIHRVGGTHSKGEGGLLGITLHPNFIENNYLYLYYTYRTLPDSTTRNKVERYTYIDGASAVNALTEPHTVIENIPGAKYHDGGRIAFGPDSYLYITTGDATTPQLAQDLTSLAGKILRLRDDGGIPDDNPFANSPVYSYGHRNSQGLTWDTDGNLWSTEHGRSGLRSGLDEVNLIHPGNNYGWPDSQGDTVQQGTIAPKQHSGPKTTWAPASAAYHNGTIYFGGLRGEALYVAPLNGTTLLPPERRYHNEFGRIRTVKVGPDNALYITTSNQDGRGRIRDGDDKLIRLLLQ